jgi:1,4-dihydroxy-2-naphthoate octaprenyltransferase
LGAAEVKRAALLASCVAVAAGLVAVQAGGWPILAIGVASLVAGWAYSNGPLPIAITPLGELFVVLFFGIGAVCGAAHLANPAALSAHTLALGTGIGLPAAAVLLVNNHRDRAEDRRNGRRTLAIVLGENGARALYAGLLLAAVALVVLPARALGGWIGVGAMLLALPPATWLAVHCWKLPVGRGLNALLARTAAFQLMLAALYALAVMIGRLLA